MPLFKAVNLASPPAIGNTTPNSGSFTTLNASEATTLDNQSHFNGLANFNNQATIQGDGSENSLLRVGTLEFQPFAINNVFMAENAYYEGGFKRRNEGEAGLFYFQGSEGQFRFAAYDDAEAGFGNDVHFKINLTGEMACGVAPNAFSTGDFAEFGFYVHGANARCSVASTGKFSFSEDANANGSDDIAIGRNAVGVLEVNSGSGGTFRDLIVRNLRMSAPTGIPSTASSAGAEGDIRWNASHIYVCVATNTWKRVAIATF